MKTILTIILAFIVSAGMAQSKEWKRAEYITDSAMIKNFTIQQYRDMDSAIKHYYHYYLFYTKLRDSLNANKNTCSCDVCALSDKYTRAYLIALNDMPKQKQDSLFHYALLFTKQCKILYMKTN